MPAVSSLRETISSDWMNWNPVTLRIAGVLPASGVIFREVEPSYDWNFHVAPQKQYIVLLDGKIEIETSLGKTIVWGLYTKEEHLDSLVIFPGARTTSLIWDFDKGLQILFL